MEPRLHIREDPQQPLLPRPAVPDAKEPKKKRCRVCAAEIPEEAKKCQPCGTYQDWRVVVPGSSVVISLLIALFSVIGSLVPQVIQWLHRHSDTSVHIIGASEHDLFVIVSNEGNRPALLRRYEVSFSGIPLATEELVLMEPEKALVMAREGKQLTLQANVLRPAAGHTREEVVTAIAGGTVTLTTWVKESSDTAIDAETARVDRAPARQLGEWIEKRMEEQKP